MSEVPHDVAQVLVDNHRTFLAFLERRVSSPEVAEDILHEAFTRGLDRLDTLRDEEPVVAWRYRTLRNAVVDHYRRTDARKRSLERLAADLDPATADPELQEEVCKCALSHAETLKPEYAEAIRRIDVEGSAVKDFAAENGLRGATRASGCSARARRCANRSRRRAGRARRTGASTARAGRVSDATRDTGDFRGVDSTMAYSSTEMWERALHDEAISSSDIESMLRRRRLGWPPAHADLMTSAPHTLRCVRYECRPLRRRPSLTSSIRPPGQSPG